MCFGSLSYLIILDWCALITIEKTQVRQLKENLLAIV